MPLKSPTNLGHTEQVDAWLTRAEPVDSVDGLLGLLETGFGALWRRAYLALGEVTLTAIAERVLHHAVERDPRLQGLVLTDAGLDCAALRERAATLEASTLRTGVRSVLIEFLTILGRLTAEVLTPALHAELARAATEEVG